MPVQLPVLTAHTKVFSSPAAAVAVFSTLVAIAAFDELKVSPIHAELAHANSSVRLQASRCSCSKRRARDASPAPDSSKRVATVLSAKT